MKTTLRKVFLSILLIFVAGVGACFSSNNNEGVIKFEDNGICYKVTDKLNKTVEVVAKGKYTGSIVIPETVIYNDIVYSVTSIGRGAFGGCVGLINVIIPGGVSIGNGAFKGTPWLNNQKR